MSRQKLLTWAVAFLSRMRRPIASPSPDIKPAFTLVVYITPDTLTSKWVNWEIRTAAMMGKRIVDVWAHGDAGCPMPSALDKYHHAIVGWNGGNIVRAINGQLYNSYVQRGNHCAPSGKLLTGDADRGNRTPPASPCIPLDMTMGSLRTHSMASVHWQPASRIYGNPQTRET